MVFVAAMRPDDEGEWLQRVRGLFAEIDRLLAISMHRPPSTAVKRRS